MTRQQAAAGQQAPSPAALVGMATAAAARAAVAAAPRAGASSRAVLAPPAAAASKRAAPVKAPKRPAPAAGGASVAAQHSFRPLRRDPMVQFADGNYYQASVLQVTDGRVLLACQPGEWALPQEFWLPRSSPRIWAGSYAPAAWRHKGGGAWQPRSQQAPDKAAAGAAGGSNAAEAQQPAAAEGGGHDEGVPGAAGNDAAAADTAPAAAADDAAGAAAGVSTVAEGPSAP